MPANAVPTTTPSELHQELRRPAPPRVLDVREEHELKISRLPNIVHIPLGELPQRFAELDPAADWVVVCRSGGRSAQATAFLMQQGFGRVRNMETGMNGYAETVDNGLTVY